MITGTVLPDLALLIYISVLTSYTIKQKRKNSIHELDRKFFLVLIPYIITISLSSAAFAAQRQILTHLILSVLAVNTLAAGLKYIKPQKKAYIFESAAGTLFLTIAYISTAPDLEALAFTEIATITFSAFIPVYILHIIFKEKTTPIYLFPILTHYFDAASTVIALEKGLRESRALARLFIENLGPYGIFGMKSLVIIPIAYYLSEEVEKEISRELLYLIGIYGLVLGLRNLLLISLSA